MTTVRHNHFGDMTVVGSGQTSRKQKFLTVTSSNGNRHDILISCSGDIWSTPLQELREIYKQFQPSRPKRRRL